MVIDSRGDHEPEDPGMHGGGQRPDDPPIGFAALLRHARRRREWCCEACRQAAELNRQRP